MKIKRFDVVKLTDNNKATILDIKDNIYLVEVVNMNGNSLGIRKIKTDEIKEIIFQK